MKHHSHLPISLVASVLAGAICVMICRALGGGFWLAVLTYSVGGAVALIGTAALLSVRAAVPTHTLQTA